MEVAFYLPLPSSALLWVLRWGVLCVCVCVRACALAHILGQEEEEVPATGQMDRETEPLDRTKFLKKLFRDVKCN